LPWRAPVKAGFTGNSGGAGFPIAAGIRWTGRTLVEVLLNHSRKIFAVLLLMLGFCRSASASTPADALITGNIQTGLGILGDTRLSEAERKAQFQAFLLGVTDMKRIALFTLGPYADSASDADKAAFIAAFQDYAVAVYQSWLAHYCGHTLAVRRSYERAPGDVIVVTDMTTPGTAQPLEIDFRVRTDSDKPQIVDFNVAGMWLALVERDDFSAVLGRSKGDVAALTAHLRDVARQY
jgi:phospholipid transport system substrate-binding protein